MLAVSKAKLIAERERIKNLESEFNLKILHAGDAVNFPKPGDTVSVHYLGYLPDGSPFDDSYSRGQPIYFILGAEQVLKGWEVILPIMSRGQKAKFTLPPEYAYGDKGYPPIIAPKAHLTFELELLNFTSFGNIERVTREKRATREVKPVGK